MTELVTVRVEGERFYADMVGYTPAGHMACLGIVGRRTGIGRALIKIHRGEAIEIDNEPVEMLGAGMYRVAKSAIQGPRRLVRAWIMPTSAVQQVRRTARRDGSKDGKDSAADVEQVLVWRQTAQASVDGESALWNWVRESTPVPTLDAWAGPVLARLRDAEAPVEKAGDAGDGPDEESSTETRPVLGQVRFAPAGDGRWRGVVVNLSERTMTAVVQQALRAGEISVPLMEAA